MKLAIAGMSHVGLSNAILLAQHNEVVILDADADAVDQINHQRCPIDDPELADYLSHKPLKLRATLDRREAYQDAHFVIIATPTDGEPKMNGLNTQTVEAVIQDVLAINPEALMVIMSTLPVGFTAWARQTYATDKLIFSPGFLREGKALHDQPYPSRMIVGERSERARRFAGLLQQSAIQQHIPTLFTDSAEAEAIKLLSNAYLAMRAAYFKALDNYAVTHGLDARQLIDGVCLDPRIGAHDLDHGGDCPPEDATQWLANDRDLSQLLHAIIETNAAAYDETRLKKSRAPLQSGDGDGLAQPNQEALGDEGNRAGNHSQQSLAPNSTGENQAALPESRSGNQPPRKPPHADHRQILDPRPSSGLFSIPVFQASEEKPLTLLGFHAQHPEWLQAESNQVHFDVPEGKILYLVTSESGRFDQPPAHNRLQLEPETQYLVKGKLNWTGDNRPNFWWFEYDGAKKINAKSTPCLGKTFALTFKTQAQNTQHGFGLRLMGKGSLGVGSAQLTLITGLEATVAEQGERIAQLQKQRPEREILKKLEDFMRIQHYLGSEIVLPPMHGWLISPDFGLKLIQQLEQKPYDAVIEFGSGASTLLIARALQKRAQKTKTTAFISYDHLQQYLEQTRKTIEQAGLLGVVNLQLAPLEPYAPNPGESYYYYACRNSLDVLAKTLPTTPRLLVVVDGPPAATGRHARYPALPLLLEWFSDAQMDILMDDYIRMDEQQIAARWQELLDEQGKAHILETFNDLEKQACLLQINPAG